jgi:hypothetical protein
MGTRWKLKGNIVGTHWEPGRNFSCQRVHHHFWPGLIPLAKNTCCDHINWFMGAFYFIFEKKSYSLAHHHFFWNIGHSCMEVPPLWTPSCKIETNVFPLKPTFSVYIHGSWTLGKPLDKTKLLLRTSWGMYLGTLWELNETSWEDYRTPWEPIGNKGKKSLSPLPPIGNMIFLFPKLFVTIFRLG